MTKVFQNSIRILKSHVAAFSSLLLIFGLNTQPLYSILTTNTNQQNVFLALENIPNLTIEETAIRNELLLLSSSPLTFNEARLALSQMSGEQYTNMIISSELSSRNFVRRLFDPVRLIINANRVADFNYNPCDCTFYDTNISNSFEDNASGPWLTLGGGRSFLNRESSAAGFRMNSFQLDVGYQQTLYDYWTLGIAGGYQYDNLSNRIGGKGNNHFGLLGLYTLYRPASYYFLTDLAFNFGSSSITRNIEIDTLSFRAKGKPQSFQATLYSEIGKDINTTFLLIQPFFGIELSQFYSKKYSEHGASPLNLSLKEKNKTNAYSRLGVHLATKEPCSQFVFSVDLAWQYRLTNFSNSLKGHFQEFGDSFVIDGIAMHRSSFDGTANLSFALSEHFSIFTEFSGQSWENASTYSVVGGLMAKW